MRNILMVRSMLIVAAMAVIAALQAGAVVGNYRFAHITGEDGLPHQQVSALANDHDGQLWIGTRNGLAVYDGYHMVNYYNDPDNPHSLSHNFISTLYCDSKGRMWVGSYGGICVYSPDTDSFKRYAGLDRQVSSIVENSKGQIVCGGTDLYIYDEAQDNFELLPHQDLGYIISLAFDKDDRLFLATNKSIYYFDTSFSKTTQISKTYFSDFITGFDGIIPMFFDSKGLLWIGRNGKGVMNIDIATGEANVWDASEISDGTVRVIREDLKHNIWLGTEKGVTVINPDSGDVSILRQNFIDKNELNDNAVYDILCDSNGNVWIATYFGGINALLSNNEQFHWIQPGYDATTLRGKAVREMIEPDDGTLWIATEDGGLNIYDTEKHEIRVFDKIPVLGHNVHCLHYDSVAGSVWIGTFRNGLFRYDKGGSWKRWLPGASGLNSDAIFGIANQRDGKIWVATTQGLCYYNRENDSFEKIGHPILDTDFCYCLLVDGDDNLWVGTRNNGLFLIDSLTGEVSGWSASTPGSLLNDNYVTCLYQDGERRIWVGTNNDGVRYVEPDSLKLMLPEDGLSLRNNTVCSIIEDNVGSLWVSTGQGLFQFSEDRNAFLHYAMEDGVPVNQFNFASSILASNGLLYFGSVNGLVFFDPKTIRRSKGPFPVHLRQLEINNQVVTASMPESPLSKSLDDTERIYLTYDQSRSFSIEYGTVSLGNTSSIFYQVKLDGVDDEWRDVGEVRQFIGMGLASGSYTLHIRANNSNEGWNDAPVKSIAIEIGEPFYLSAWAWVVYILILLSIVYLYYRFVSIRVQAKSSIRLANMEKEKVEELNRTKMDFFTAVSHDLKTPLSLIVAPLKWISQHCELGEEPQKRLDIAIKNTQKMVGIINELVTFNKMQSGVSQLYLQEGNPLNFIQNTASLFLEGAQENDVQLSINCENNGENVWFSPLYVERITSNLLSNALKFTPAGGSVAVKACIVEGDDKWLYLRIEVSDTGIGIVEEELKNIFERYYQTKRGHNTNNKGWGLGLALVKQLTEAHKGHVEVKSKIGQGSTFVVYLNVSAAAFDAKCKIDKDKTVVDLARYDFESPVPEVVHGDSAPQAADAPAASDSRISILVVEDNKELLDFMVDYFSPHYTVYSAQNGVEALKIVERQQLISLVISDIMMPEMDGVTLCKTLKNNIATSHISVILLTAKSETEDVLQGYRSGAEAYISKPFDPQILELQVNNIISMKRALQANMVDAKAEDVNSTQLSQYDKEFINKINQLIEKNIDNDEFSVASVTQEMGISRSLLHIKMKNLLNVSMGDYIRRKRLNLACELLKQGFNVSETAYRTGFSDPNYFSKAFKKEFGLTPTEFVANKHG